MAINLNGQLVGLLLVHCSFVGLASIISNKQYHVNYVSLTSPERPFEIIDAHTFGWCSHITHGNFSLAHTGSTGGTRKYISTYHFQSEHNITNQLACTETQQIVRNKTVSSPFRGL